MQYKRIRKLCAKFSQTGSVPDIQHATRSWIPTIGRHCYIVLNHLRVRWKSVIPWALRERFIIHIVKQYIGGTLRSWLVYNQSILMVKEHFIMLYRKINKKNPVELSHFTKAVRDNFITLWILTMVRWNRRTL